MDDNETCIQENIATMKSICRHKFWSAKRKKLMSLKIIVFM